MQIEQFINFILLNSQGMAYTHPENLRSDTVRPGHKIFNNIKKLIQVFTLAMRRN